MIEVLGGRGLRLIDRLRLTAFEIATGHVLSENRT